MSIAKRLISRTILAKVYANDKMAKRFYKPLPNEPTGPEKTSVWHQMPRNKVPDYVRGKVHYELGHSHDEDRIMEFVQNEIIPNSPLVQALGANPRDVLDFYAPIVKRSLQDHCSLLSFAGEELVGISLHTLHDVKSKLSGSYRSTEVLPSKDYSAEIDKAPFKNRAAKKLHVFFSNLRDRFEDLLPDARKVMVLECGGVARRYSGRGISEETVKNTLKLAKDKFQCDYCIAYMADSKAAQKLLQQKLSFQLVREFKLDHYMDHEIPAFPDHDDVANSIVQSGKLLVKRL
ncbi:hypothetical protein M3Y98_00127300 [Aphelenchoides besseyi]|nr:hypothetical protein M3Y98_00127300 [Aphelenchoides besseyi]KAI6199576.1 hypothetical protein M3Y96_00641600 [Aphelenchoides besseyi]